MNERQSYALAHPLNHARQDILPYRELYRLPSKVLIVSILCVDR